jgi:Na+(H+)/acetate symporter ActP
MSESRKLRLLGLVLAVEGLLGSGLVLAGWEVAGGLAFPLSAAGGIVLIVANRPRKRRRPRA